MKLVLLRRCELVKPSPFGGQGELLFAGIGCGLWFIALFFRLSVRDDSWTWMEKLVECIALVGFSGVPVFFFATPPGSRWVRSVLLKYDGLFFQLGICCALALYIFPVAYLGWDPNKFSWLGPLRRVISDNPFSFNAMAFLSAAFIVLRLPFLFLKLRSQPPLIKHISHISKLFSHHLEITIVLTLHLIACSVLITDGYLLGFAYIVLFLGMNLPFSRQPGCGQRLQVFDFFLVLTCLGAMILFSSLHFDFASFISVHLFIVVVMYGTGLGREHFGYSFQVRLMDLKYYLKITAIACIVLIPLTLGLQFNRPLSGIPSPMEIVTYLILFSFRVGVMEEILFRSGLMVFVRDSLYRWQKAPQSQNQLVIMSTVITAIIFGVFHFGNNPGDGSLLSELEFKAVYIFLGSIAATFYGLAFGETNRLWCSVFLHGLIDTTAVLLLKVPLTAPF